MLLDTEIKIGEVYAYDIDGALDLIRRATKTVKILQSHGNGTLTVECQQTNDLFYSHTDHLTTIDRLKKILEGYKNVALPTGEDRYVVVLGMEIDMALDFQKRINRMEEILFRYGLDCGEKVK